MLSSDPTKNACALACTSSDQCDPHNACYQGNCSTGCNSDLDCETQGSFTRCDTTSHACVLYPAGTQPDAGADAAADVVRDAGTDAATDIVVDAGTDAATDVVVVLDAGTDAAVQDVALDTNGPDDSSDAGVDGGAGLDGDGPDAAVDAGTDATTVADAEFDSALDGMVSDATTADVPGQCGDGGARVFGTISTAGTAARFGAAIFADIDGDGDTDVVATAPGTNAFWAENQSSGWTSHGIGLINNASGSVTGVAAADVDGDGDQDVAVASGTLKLFRNDGSSWVSILSGGTGMQSVAFADLDRDGRLDLVYGDGTGAAYQRNLGNGSFGSRISLGMSGSVVRVADVDLDGFTDVVDVGSAFQWWKNGTGQVVTNASPTSSVRSFTPVDWDLDGDIDVVYLNGAGSTGGVVKVLLDLVSSTGTVVDLVSVASGQQASAGDFDGDGDVDLVWGGASTSVLNFGQRTTGNSFVQSTTAGLGQWNQTVGLGDFDHDGDLEVVEPGGPPVILGWSCP